MRKTRLNHAVIACAIMSALTYSCKSQEIQTDEAKDYTAYFERQESRTDSMFKKLDAEYKRTSEKLSSLKIENTTTYYTLPDSIGKQYPVVVSTTKADKNEKEKEEMYAELSGVVERLQTQIDSLSELIKGAETKKEKLVELSWWDANKGKVYMTVACVIIALAANLIYKLKRKEM